MDLKNYDDKDLAMFSIFGLCVVGGIVLGFVGVAIGAREILVTAIASLFTGSIAAIAALATGRKGKEG